MKSTVNLKPADLALDILANQFIDLVAAFSRRDAMLALATLDECSNRIAGELRSFTTLLEEQGTCSDVQQVVIPAAEMLQKTMVAARKQANRSAE